MEQCVNHPDRKAYSICHGCGKHYCEDCLTAGNEYYYCNNPECQKLLRGESKPGMLPEEVKCPNCSAEFKLSDKERISRKVHCPECESFIDYTSDPPTVFNPDKYTRLLSTMNQGDIALIKSVLENGQIDYYVNNENFSRIDPLIQPAIFYVAENQIEQAREALKDFDVHIFGISVKNEDEE